MKNHFVIDTSVYLTYASYDKIYRLENAVTMYELVVYINQQLLDELQSNLPKVIVAKDVSAKKLLDIISSFTVEVDVKPIFKESPDPKDNFLFDLALQTGSEVIVTQEKALLGFAKSPIPIRNIKWFKENFSRSAVNTFTLFTKADTLNVL